MNTQHIQIQLLLPQSFSSRNHPILSPPQRLHRKKFTTFTIKRTSLFSYGGSGCSRSKFRCSVKDVEEQKQKQQQQVVKRAYPFHEIEPKWQTFWENNRTFRTPDEIDTSKPKFYVLDMFPYPSGAGLHVGHPLGYTATDILARLKRMQGYNVLHPMGWDAFGLPAEQYAIETGTHPKITTLRNINRFRTQLKSLGFSYDWDREISTIEPDFYKWTQWIFLQLLKRGLAYQAEVPVNWCPVLGTVLANEEVVDGVSERGGHPVIRKPMRQWILKITEYADRLLEDLDDVDWPESLKEMQRNWIGKSEGAQMEFPILDSDGQERDVKITIYTTRPDTIFGATYLVLAPEHILLPSLVSKEQSKCVEEYKDIALRKSELKRTELQKEKTGVFSGGYARNPVNGEAIPIWVADYVLGSYGTGAIMAVPAHDSRDQEFALNYDIPILPVVKQDDESCSEGTIINSSNVTTGLDINGLSCKEAASKVIEWAEKTGNGKKKVNYKLRDWLFARQRYWGEPIPVIFLDGTSESVPLNETELPPNRRLNHLAATIGASAASENLQVYPTAAPAKSDDDVVIVSAVRTPICKARRGGFKDTHPTDLLSAALKGAVERAKVSPKDVQDIIVGNVLPPGGGAVQARMAQFFAGIPEEVPIATVNRQCSSGLQAIANIAGAIRSGSIDVGIGAGVESMSLGNMTDVGEVNQKVFDNPTARDCLLGMGETSENVAEKYGVSREKQDRFAADSYNKAVQAIKNGKFKSEIVPVQTVVKDKEGKETAVTISEDDGAKPTTLEQLQKLKPVFRKGGSSTAGNSSQVSDGAAAVVLARRSAANKLGLPVLGRLVSYSVVGVPPSIMGIGPAFAIPEALKRAGLSTNDIDVYEINEAFASQALYSIETLKLDMNKVNPNGGAIALGHPLGCTGARQTATLFAELKRTKGKYGVVSMCIGTGMGAAAVYESEQ